jgi:hypothetical protein
MIANYEEGDQSPVLEAAFNSPCIEGQTKTYNLISTPPSAFRLLVEFMYRDSLDSLITSYDVRRQLSNILDPNRYSSEALKEIEAELKVDVKLLIEVWYLGDYFIMPNLQDWALMHLEIARTNYKTLPALEDVWEAANGDSTSLLWKWALANSVVNGLDFRGQRERWQAAPKEVLVEILTATQELEGKERPFWPDYRVRR